MGEDLIKRSDAIGAITNHCENECYYRVDNWCPQCQREEFQAAIKAVPSADRPQGEWERIPYSFVGGYRCTICGQKSLENHWSYCPKCGAKMKGVDDERTV